MDGWNLQLWGSPRAAISGLKLCNTICPILVRPSFQCVGQRMEEI